MQGKISLIKSQENKKWQARILVVLLCAWLILPQGEVQARDLKIIFSQYTPPYVFENGSGILVDIVRAALEPAGYHVIPVYLPLGRGFEMFAQKLVDGTATISENSGLKANYSNVFMQYHNCVFGLKSRHFKVNGLDDLKAKNMIAFQNAHKYLGEDFGQAVLNQPNYKEIANQETQTLMLMLGRIDLAVMDESIFRFYREKLISEGKAAHQKEIESFQIFPPTPYQAAFVDATVRDDFNRGIKAIRSNGRYDAIYRHYVEQYFNLRK